MKRVLGFTLVELLIVIAVIAILSSLLLPALNQAKEKGRQVLCLNNLKQCDIATFSYSNDYGGFAPTYYQTPYNRGSYIADIRWSALLYIGNYLPNVTTAWCPTDNEASIGFYPGSIDPFQHSTFTYGMFSSLGTWYKIAMERTPSQRTVYADSIYFFTYSGYNKWHSHPIAIRYL